MPKMDEQSFFCQRYLNEIANLKDNGKIASLKRNVGNTLEDSRHISWFFDLLSRHCPAPADASWRSRQENIYFLIACLMATDRASVGANKGSISAEQEEKDPGSKNGSSNFGQTLSILKGRAGINSAFIDRRFAILLDSELDQAGSGELAYRLRQIVKVALGKNVPINWPSLLDDLLRWDQPGKQVQKSWARSYWNPNSKDVSADNLLTVEGN